MTTTIVRQPAKKPQIQQFPPLHNGDHLTRAEFERRYASSPQVKKAELIEGVVYMPSPVSIRHGKTHANIMVWLGTYRAYTSGTEVADNVTIRLDWENEVQPDGVLYVNQEFGGQVEVEGDYLAGAPELIIEVAASSAAYDLHEKLRVYRRNGVQEYLVLLAYEQETRWFSLQDGEYVLVAPDEKGVLRSHLFPGLHLQSDLFWGDDLAGLLQVLQEGIGTPEHQAFVAQLQQQAEG